MPQYAMVWIFSALGVLFVGGAIIFSKLLAPKSPDTENKLRPYECSMESIGTARIQFKIGYYLFALIFMVFDVEALFLFPCVGIFRDIAAGKVPSVSCLAFFAELGLFVIVLFIGLLYAWKKKVLEWE